MTTIYQPFIWDNLAEPVPELSETLTQYTTVIVLTFLTSTANLSTVANPSTFHPLIVLVDTDETGISSL